MTIRLFLIAAGALVVMVVAMVVAACQPPPSEAPTESAAPGDGASPAGSTSPGGGSTPIAPAVEQTHPDAERTLVLPSSVAPVAPDIEIESGPDPTVPAEPE